jgi:hypothetical protein
MKENSQIQKFISVLMIFILLPYLSGCISTKIISKANLPLPDPGKYAYIIHAEKIKFLLEKSTISNDTLSGKILQTYFDNAYDAGNKIHLYFSSDSVIKIDDKGEFLSVPVDEITKAELQEIHGVGTAFIIIGSALVAFVGIAFILFLINGWPNMLPPFDG